ncbi:hypothetical protein OF83DRAFT_93727, partial [Amylostereum chailletii]
MKFTAVITTLIFASCAYAASIAERQTGACYSAVHQIAADRPFVQPLADACLNSINKDVSQLWNSKLCVAAGVTSSPGYLRDYATCGAANETEVPVLAAIPHLDYSVYAEIVGSCAYDEGGCPITQQNFIDLVYSAISGAGLTIYPNVDDLITYYIQPLITWANTGE